ncbi:MAG TPA: hypothetical protein VFE92_08590 [Dermatophilaceae bacterium]|nr:hypothetical protein [Dermatophilaceae bacterium]
MSNTGDSGGAGGTERAGGAEHAGGAGHAGGSAGHVGPFVTFVEHRRPDGHVARWESRRHRKQLGGAATAGSIWWAPTARGWWIAVLFAVGSSLFALGTVPAYVDAVGARWDAVTYFVGSLVLHVCRLSHVSGGGGRRTFGAGATRRRFFVFQPHRIDWWATAVQLLGTLFFNLSCGNALRANLTAQAAHQHVWRPDAFGSICFLVASTLAWFEVCHGWVAWRPRSWAWWITLANLTGSVAFGISAVAAYINPVTGEVTNADRSALVTSPARCASSSVPCSSCLSERSPNRRSPSRQKESETPDRSLRCQASMMTGMINGLRR